MVQINPITDEKRKEIAERNQRLGFGTITPGDGQSTYKSDRQDFSYADPSVEPSLTDIKAELGDAYAGKDTSELDRLQGLISEPSEAEIRAREREQMQAQIDALNASYEDERAILAQQAAGRVGSTRAMSARGGLLGSARGEAQAIQTEQFNTAQRQALQAEINAQIQAITSKTEDRISQKLAAEREYAAQNYEKYQAERNRIQGEARMELTALGSAGGTLDDLDPATKSLMLEQSGMSEFAANAVIMASNPQANANYQIVGNKIVGYYFDPKSGQIKTMESEALPGVTETDEFQMIDGVPYVLSRDESGKLQGEVLPGYQETEEALDVFDLLEIEERQLKIDTLRKKLVEEAELEEDPEYKSTQYQAAGYAQRLEDATLIIDEVLARSAETATGKRGLITKFLPNILKSDERKSLEQAQRNFINAVLRRESGAAIAPSEFENAEKQYFPQPGDDQKTLEQKERNRNVVIQGFKNEAGGAYNVLNQKLDGTEAGVVDVESDEDYNFMFD